MTGRRLRMSLLTALFFVACQCGQGSERSSVRRAFVSVAPQAELLRRIAGDLWEVEVLVPSGQSPATYDATPRQLARLSRAQLYVRIGVPFENGFFDKIGNIQSKLTVVDQREGVTLLSPDGNQTAHEGHGAHADHHIWLAPAALQIQARTLCDALVAADPTNEERYRANLAGLRAELTQLHQDIDRRLHAFRGRTLFVNHPALTYFAGAFGLRQEAIEEHGHEPSARRMAELTKRGRREGWKTLYVQREFSDENARVLAEGVGAEVVMIEPLAPDLLANLSRLAATVATRLALED